MQFPGTVDMTAGGAGFRARGENAAVARGDDLAAAVDDIPGDTTSTATLAVGGSVAGSVDFENDSDWYRVEVEAGKTYVFDLEGQDTNAGTLGDPYLELYDVGGNILYSGDDGGADLNARLGYLAGSDGAVFVAAKALGGIGSGTYRLSASELIGDVPADTMTAATLAGGGSVTGSIDFGADSDWYRVEVEAGKTYIFDLEGEATGAGTLADPDLALYDADGHFLRSDFYGGDGRNARLSYSPTSDGVVFVAAESAWDETGTYRLSARELAGSDISDDTATTAALDVGGSVTGSVDFVSDADWYRVEVEAGKTYVFDLEGHDTGAGTIADPHLELYDTDGFSRWSDYDSGQGLNARLGYYSASDGVVFIAAQSYLEDTGTYRLSADELLGDVTENTTTTAKLAIGGSVTGSIDFEWDNDWYRVEVETGKTYQFGLGSQDVGPDTFFNLALRLYDADGLELRWDDSGSEGSDDQLRYSFASDGIVYIAAEASYGTGTYRLSAGEWTGALPPGEFELSSLDGSNGFVIEGTAANIESGFSVSDAGDINGDGIDDLIVGAPDFYSHTGGGQSYVVFGRSGDFADRIDPSTLDGSTGFIIDGIAIDDRSGCSVRGAGDINGDGVDDLVIGASRADPNGEGSGASYVVFGSTAGFAPVLELSSLDGGNGFAINGIAADDFSGSAVSGAGDINGDGIDDLVIGAPGPSFGTGSGTGYVVFGSTAGFDPSLELSLLDGSNGFAITHIPVEGGADRNVGSSVSAAGDVNGDGFDDVIVGAGARWVEAGFVVFGSAAGFAPTLDVSSLDGSNGFGILGAGSVVSTAGDINGDGLDDLVVHQVGYQFDYSSRPNANFIVFGSGDGFEARLDPATLDGRTGFRIDAPSYSDTGFSVDAAGDINGDGLDDLIVGEDGDSYVMFGSVAGFSANPELIRWAPETGYVVDDRIGFKLIAARTVDNSGHSVSGAGDINHDDIDDLIIGAPRSRDFAGASYVVFGRPDDQEIKADGNSNGVLEGGGNDDTLIGNGGDDRLYGLRGEDSLVGGSGNDRLDGGNDVDRLYGGAGDDAVLAGRGGDRMNGGSGDDRLFGHADDDLVSGAAGSDTIFGGAGDDKLHGFDGDDTLVGGAGIDVLSGEAGADRFVYTSVGGGIDRIIGFETGPEGDAIDVSDALSGFAIGADVTGFINLRTHGSHTYLQIDPDGGGDAFVDLAILKFATGLALDRLVADGNLVLGG